MTLLVVERLQVMRDGHRGILHDVSFNVMTGERVAVIGPNGAGKTSLLHTLAGALTPGAGHVRLAGEHVQTGRFNPAVTLVFQRAEDQLFCPSLREDVAYGARAIGYRGAALDQMVDSALERTGLSGLDDRLTHQLSGGEQRMACVAGALVMRPHLLLLDEPSALLDARNRRRLIDCLRTLDLALLLASHDLELVRELCSRVLLIDKGRLCADGPVDDILADTALMRAHGQEVPASLKTR